ncbi:MAG: hypothetical protein NT154_16275, partial [Verrucomicrobia bacterium]|nr:hypothetical protein [Verrucomicrobiota bacterium]
GGHRSAPPGACYISILTIATGPQESTQTVKQATLVLAYNPYAPSGSVFDGKALGSESWRDRQLHHQRRFTRPYDIGSAPLLKLVFKHTGDIADHRAGLRRNDQPYRFRSFGMQGEGKGPQPET